MVTSPSFLSVTSPLSQLLVCPLYSEQTHPYSHVTRLLLSHSQQSVYSGAEDDLIEKGHHLASQFTQTLIPKCVGFSENVPYIILCQSSICLCLWPVTHLPLVERLKCGPPVVVTESQLMSLSWCSILYPRSEIASPLFLSYQWAPWSLFTTFWVMWVPEHFLLFFNHTLWAKANAAGFVIDTVVQKRWQCCGATQVTNKAPC